MASDKMVMLFKTDTGENVSFIFPYVDPEVSTLNVQALASALISNGSIFAKPPVTLEKAYILPNMNVREINIS